MDDELIGVPDNHRRGISATLGYLSETLAHFRRWAEGCEVSSVLYVEENHLSPPQRVQILLIIDQIEDEIRDICGKMKLKAQKVDVARVMEVKCGFLWEGIEELRGHSLLRYGEVSLELSDYMNLEVIRLVELLTTLSQTAHTNPDQKENPCGGCERTKQAC